MPPAGPGAESRATLEALAARIRAIETGGRLGGDPGRGRVRTGWPGVDGPGGAGEVAGGAGAGLARGVLHEFLGVGDGADWSPPLALLTHLAGAALEERLAAEGAARPWRVLWLGRRVWPYPGGLAFGERPVQSRESAAAAEGLRLELAAGMDPAPAGPSGDRAPRSLLERCLFVDAPEDWTEERGRARPGAGEVRRGGAAGRRLWAADRALRCPSVAVVVLDASGLDMAATRRLQLAAEAGGGLALAARPAGDARRLSAAASRWRVERVRPSLGPESAMPAAAGACGVLAWDAQRPAWILAPLQRRSGGLLR